jgi:hypothetical protein
VSVVLAEVPRGVGAGDARRLEARAREREAVLVATETRGAAWPGNVAYALRAAASTWDDDGTLAGILADRRLRVEVEGRGAAARPRAGELARAG